MSTPNDLAASIRDLASRERQQQGVHPPPDALLDYHAGRLADDDRESIQDHLAVCASCARAVLDMATFPEIEPVDPSHEISDEQIPEELTLLRERLAEEDGRPAAPTVTVDEPANDEGGGRRTAALAAALFAACLGLLFWNVSLRQEVTELRSPRANVPTVTLEASDVRVRSSDNATARITQGVETMVVFGLFWPDDEILYALTLFDANGDVIERRTRQHLTTDGANVLLSGQLPAGEYRIEIRRELDEDSAPYKEFLFTIE